MSNVSDKDGKSSSYQVPEATGVARDGTLMTGEQSVATSEIRIADPRTL